MSQDGEQPIPECTLDTSVVDWVVEHPETANVLGELGIDGACAGKSLRYECHRQGLDPRMVLARLLRVVDGGHSGRSGPG